DISHGSITISFVEAGAKMGIGFDNKDLERFANTITNNILRQGEFLASNDVAGRGDGNAYFPQVYNYLFLSKTDPLVFDLTYDAYLKWDGESFPFISSLLKWKSRLEID